MKTIILFAILSSTICLSCTNKRQQTQPEATPDKELAIIGGSDTVTMIQVNDISKHSKKCTFYTLRFGCSFAAVNTIKPQLL